MGAALLTESGAAPKPTKEGIVESILQKLKEVMDQIERLDDPTAPDLYRDFLEDIHCDIEEIISKLED